MAAAPNLLNDDGTASMATVFMMTHHAFRRDLASFARVLATLTPAHAAQADALREEWQRFHGALHGHHEMEDTRIFAHMKMTHPPLAATLERLSADHRKLDPLLERGDRAFAALPDSGPATKVIEELRALLDPHLALEEAEVVPLLREAKMFPAPATDAEAELYADGFAWSSHGIAPDVLARVAEFLPAILAEKIPARRATFEARCERVWGTAKAGATRTPIPE